MQEDKYQKGEVYSFDGVNRLVIGFDGNGNPITTTDLEYEEETAASGGMAEVEEVDLTENYKELLRLIPLDKCKREVLAAVAEYVGIDISAASTNDEMITTILK